MYFKIKYLLSLSNTNNYSMDLLPFEDYSLYTKLSNEEVMERIAAYVEPKQPFSLQYFLTVNTKPYEGGISSNGFRIKRIIPYTNTFLPVINGTVTTYFEETEIKIKMRMMIGVLVVISIWCIVAVLFAALIILSMIQSRSFHLSILTPIFMILVPYYISTSSFKRESDISKEFFERVFDAEIVL